MLNKGPIDILMVEDNENERASILKALMLTPVVVFTCSQELSNIYKRCCFGSNNYLVKPWRFTEFQAVAETVGRYWMKHNRCSA